MKNEPYGKENESHLGGYFVGGDNETYATEVWDWMINNNIKSVMDIGCGEGYSTKYFYDHGCEVLGIEGGINAIKNSPIKDNIVLHDYTKSSFVPNKRYDAVWCCEFVEHVKEEYVPNFLETFKYADSILMTHAVPGQTGYHHVNCQKPEYWIEKLKNIGFKYDEKLSLFLRELTNKIHVKNRLLLFKKTS
jgi:Methyltransferase domain